MLCAIICGAGVELNVLCLSSSDKLPFVSSDSYSKLVLRAINLEDTKMLQRLINDSQRVSGVKARNSPVLLSRFSSFSPTVTDRTCIPAEPDALGGEVRERVAAVHRKTQRTVSQAPPRPAPTERRQPEHACQHSPSPVIFRDKDDVRRHPRHDFDVPFAVIRPASRQFKTPAANS